MPRSSSTRPRRVVSETVNIALAKTHLPELVERAARGEEIIIARAGTPRARLVALDDDRKKLRVPGKGKNRFEMAPDFDAPLPPEVGELFEQSEVEPSPNVRR